MASSFAGISDVLSEMMKTVDSVKEGAGGEGGAEGGGGDREVGAIKMATGRTDIEEEGEDIRTEEREIVNPALQRKTLDLQQNHRRGWYLVQSLGRIRVQTTVREKMNIRVKK